MPLIDGTAWIQSFYGRAVTPLDLKHEQVSFEDIPHALSQKVRFTGHLREMGYSVAQHCAMGAEAIDAPFKLAFLLHEVSEVFLPDVASPIKPFLRITDKSGVLRTWSGLELHHQRVILEAIGYGDLFPLLDCEEVHEMDLRMLATEKRDLMGVEPQEWAVFSGPRKKQYPPLDFKIERVWPAQEAKERFIAMWQALR
jgi:hypothetical protein